MQLVRPPEALEAATEHKPLPGGWSRRRHAGKAFRHVPSRLTEELRPLAVDDARTLDAKGLRRQLSLIKHCTTKDLIVQAVLTAREWLVSWLAWRTVKNQWLELAVRQEMVKDRSTFCQMTYILALQEVLR